MDDDVVRDEPDDNDLLHTTRSLLETVLDLTDAVVFAKDLAGRYILCNRKGAEIVGMTPAEILGRTDDELYHPDQVERFQQHFDQVIETGGAITSMMPIVGPDETRTYLSHVVPLVDDGGAVYGIAGIATDVTERTRREELLQRRTRELEAAQRIARLGTWTWDPVTESLEISYELGRILGDRSGGCWTLDTLQAAVVPEDLASTVDAVRRARRGRSVDHTFRFRRSDGALRWLRLRADESSHPGDPRVGAVQDVTELEEAAQHRLELERRLLQTQRLETVGQLAGGVAHDFNNLLAVMAMQSELALAELSNTDRASTDLASDDPPETVVARLRELQATIERASALTQQLLVFSRQDEHDDEVLDLRVAILRLVPLLDQSLGSGIRLQVELPDEAATDRSPTVRVARAQVEQVIVNLAVNARDAMPDGGSLTLRVEALEAADEPGAVVRLTVRDTGTGMSPEVRERALEPFFTTKAPGIGTGLGLATVHGIVARAGGTVAIDSAPGTGTTVEIVLPAMAPAADEQPLVDADPPSPATDGGQASGATVLIVEDLEPLGRLAATVLERAGYHTLLATHADRALELLAGRETGPIDLLITDVVMPDISGRELADRVRRDHPDLPVLFMTGYSSGLLDLDLGAAGAEVLSKPFVSADLVAAVERLLSGGGSGGGRADGVDGA